MRRHAAVKPAARAAVRCSGKDIDLPVEPLCPFGQTAVPLGVMQLFVGPSAARVPAPTNMRLVER